MATKSSNPPPGVSDGGTWGEVTYSGGNTNLMCVLLCLLGGIFTGCGTCAYLCPVDKKDGYRLGDSIFDTNGNLVGKSKNLQFSPHAPFRAAKRAPPKQPTHARSQPAAPTHARSKPAPARHSRSEPAPPPYRSDQTAPNKSRKPGDSVATERTQYPDGSVEVKETVTHANGSKTVTVQKLRASQK